MNFEDFKGHIYLIDDDPSIRRSLAFSLSSLRYSIQSFENPKAFLRDSLPISPAVILLDNRMPETSGLSLQNELIRQGRSTPIIFISGESQPSEIIEALKKQGGDDIIVFVGGVIPRQDYDFLYQAGVKGIYGPGTPIPVSAKDVLQHIQTAMGQKP
jgi:CheY-like chemotaxis protein